MRGSFAARARTYPTSLLLDKLFMAMQRGVFSTSMDLQILLVRYATSRPTNIPMSTPIAPFRAGLLPRCQSY